MSNDDSKEDIRVDTFRVGEFEFAVISDSPIDLSGFEELTDAEREVVGLVFDGLTNTEIAERRDVSERTVANQLSSVYRKVGVNSRAELVAHLLED